MEHRRERTTRVRMNVLQTDPAPKPGEEQLEGASPCELLPYNLQAVTRDELARCKPQYSMLVSIECIRRGSEQCHGRCKRHRKYGVMNAHETPPSYIGMSRWD